jgi:hypothetical protein
VPLPLALFAGLAVIRSCAGFGDAVDFEFDQPCAIDKTLHLHERASRITTLLRVALQRRLTIAWYSAGS